MEHLDTSSETPTAWNNEALPSEQAVAIDDLPSVVLPGAMPSWHGVYPFAATPVSTKASWEYVERRDEELRGHTSVLAPSVAQLGNYVLEVTDGERIMAHGESYRYLALREHPALANERTSMDEALKEGQTTLTALARYCLHRLAGPALATRVENGTATPDISLEVLDRTQADSIELARFTMPDGEGREHLPEMHEYTRESILRYDPDARLHEPVREKLQVRYVSTGEYGMATSIWFAARFNHGEAGGNTIRSKELFVVPINRESPLAALDSRLAGQLTNELTTALINENDWRTWEDKNPALRGLVDYVDWYYGNEYALPGEADALPDGIILPISEVFYAANLERVATRRETTLREYQAGMRVEMDGVLSAVAQHKPLMEAADERWHARLNALAKLIGATS